MAFATLLGLYKFVSFGFHKAAATFQRLIGCKPLIGNMQWPTLMLQWYIQDHGWTICLYYMQMPPMWHWVQCCLSWGTEESIWQFVLVRKYSPRSRHIPQSKKECLAVKWEIESSCYYFMGHKFTVVTDHTPLHRLNKVRSENQKLMTWNLCLQIFNFFIAHQPQSIHYNSVVFLRKGKEVGLLASK